jgi:xylan 1,4-beta-xylosidase
LPPLIGALGPWDPALFHDETSDRWYLYFGSSNVYPIYGVELLRGRGFRYAGEPRPLLFLHPEVHGWERFGQDHRDTIRPFIEGAWMTKYKNRYYLQYAAPGTEYNVYANGTYVGDSPLGPFFYASNNPVAYKPGGFTTGAGHGNTFQDNFGNFWNTGTAWVGHNFKFERRVTMVPAGFDGDGIMFANTRFADFPHFLPTKRWKERDELFAGWMLLSYRKPATASSVLDTFRAGNVTDENPRTFWVAKSARPGESITIDLLRNLTVRAIQVNFADYRSNIYANDSTNYARFMLERSNDGFHWTTVGDLSHEVRDRPNDYVELPRPVRARYVRYVHGHCAAATLAISDIRIFGRGSGKPPRTPATPEVRRDDDARNAFVRWQRIDGAVGYNILWGISPTKLYQTYQVFADQGTTLDLRALTAGQEYYFAIEAFNENGVSHRSASAYCR